jgi:hypothetical protein
MRLLLCGAVAGSLLGVLMSASLSYESSADPGITLVQGASQDEGSGVAVQPEEPIGGSNEALAQIWLAALGAGAVFLLELVSPLGIFYLRREPTQISVGDEERPPMLVRRQPIDNAA